VRFDACRPLTLLVDEPVTDTQLLGIRAAVDLWNGRASTRLDVAVKTADAPFVPIHFRTAASPSHGFFDPGTGEVLINDQLTDHALAITVAHEVGHAFGLVHVTNRASVMSPGNLNIEPNADDVNTLTGLWGPCSAAAQAGESP
jgi:hypothetical protein